MFSKMVLTGLLFFSIIGTAESVSDINALRDSDIRIMHTALSRAVLIIIRKGIPLPGGSLCPDLLHRKIR
jgi:hypothetical protein